MSEEKLPPLGLKPRYIHDEKRLIEIREAIYRYIYEARPIDMKWVEEYNELAKRRNEND